MDQAEIRKISGEMDSLVNKMQESFKAGDIKEAGRNVPPFFEKMIYSLIGAANINIGKVDDFQSAAVNALYSEGWINDEEKNKLHKLKIIRNAFEKQAGTDAGNDQRKKEELKKYRDDFNHVIGWCRSDIKLFEEIMERICSGRRMDNSNDRQETSAEINIDENYNTACSTLKKMKEKYKAGEINEAAKLITELVQNVMTTMTTLADVRTTDDPTDSIDELYSEKWITEAEQDTLHNIRKVRNLFSHQEKIRFTGTDEEKKELEKLRSDFSIVISLCESVLELYKRRLKTISEKTHLLAGRESKAKKRDNSRSYDNTYAQSGSPYSGGDTSFRRVIVSRTNTYSSGSDSASGPYSQHLSMTPIEAIVSFKTYIPFAISLLFSVVLGLLFTASSGESGGSGSGGFIPGMIGFYLTVLLMYAFLYRITAHFFCGAFIFALARQATDSVLCATLMAIAMILIVSRFTDSIRNVIAKIFYGLGILIFVFSAIDIIKSKFGAAQGLTAVVLKYVLPSVLYILLFLVINAMVKQGIFRRPFSTVYSDVLNHACPPTLNIIAVLAILMFVIFTYRTTWEKGVITNIKEAPYAFWTLRSTLIALAIYIMSMSKISKQTD